MNVLLVAAHPDDELLGVGGTVARHVDRGDRVRLAVMCEGISMRYDAQRHAEVQAQAKAAAEILGVRDLVLRELPDQRLDAISLTDIVREIDGVLDGFEAEVLYTHFGGDINRDHRILTEAVLVATRPYAAPSVREVFMFETPSSTEWGSDTLLPAFHPNHFVDITDTLERKIEAFLRYTKEVRSFPHPRSPEALRDRARYWGSLVNRKAAEAFVLVRGLR
jgi:LmbE family N-acetylglucosaminyl deacetylase